VEHILPYEKLGNLGANPNSRVIAPYAPVETPLTQNSVSRTKSAD